MGRMKTTKRGGRLLNALANDDWDTASTIVEDWVLDFNLHFDPSGGSAPHAGYPYINMEGYDWVNCEDGWMALDAWLACIVWTMTEDDVVLAWFKVTQQYTKMLTDTFDWHMKHQRPQYRGRLGA